MIWVHNFFVLSLSDVQTHPVGGEYLLLDHRQENKEKQGGLTDVRAQLCFLITELHDKQANVSARARTVHAVIGPIRPTSFRETHQGRRPRLGKCRQGCQRKNLRTNWTIETKTIEIPGSSRANFLCLSFRNPQNGTI